MSSTSAADARSHAVVPVSISSGVMECFLSVMGLETGCTLRRLDPGTPEVMQNSASRVLRQTCVRLRRRHSCQVNVTAVFRAGPRKSGQKRQEIRPIHVVNDHFRLNEVLVANLSGNSA